MAPDETEFWPMQAVDPPARMVTGAEKAEFLHKKVDVGSAREWRHASRRGSLPLAVGDLHGDGGSRGDVDGLRW